MQVISALRNAGHRVSLSFALPGYAGSSPAGNIRPHLSNDDLWCCEHHLRPEIVLNRVQPEIALYCDVSTVSGVRRYANDIVQIVDLCEPLPFAALMSGSSEDAGSNGRLEHECRQVVERLSQVDYVITVSERQRYFWLAYCSLAGFSFSELRAAVCPFCIETDPLERKPSCCPSLLHAGGFYSWRDQERFLRAAASSLDETPGAKLHVAGGILAGTPDERQAEDSIRELQTHRSVEYHGDLPREELNRVLANVWATLDLNERTLEGELAAPDRAAQFLAAGVPIIYNNFGSFANDIREYRAGWTVDTETTRGLESVLEELVTAGQPLVEELSRNALRLSSEKLNPIEAMRPLVELCDSAGKRGSLARSRSAQVQGKPAAIGKVLAISRDIGAVGELRMNNPFRALHRQRLIDGFVTSHPLLARLAGDNSLYEVIFTQRALPEGVWVALSQLGLPYLLEVDDNLMACAGYRRNDPEEKASLISGLRQASVLTVPNPRLVHLLEKYSTLPLARKSFIVPNALPYGLSRSGAAPAAPTQILWIQSDIAALTNSCEAVIRAVETVSSRYDLPVILIGRNVLDRPRFTRQVVMGEMDFNSNLQLLAAAPTSIGVAPLETNADLETIDFICGKSDLKILLFSGYGHSGVFSASPPYTDSPLSNCAILTRNTYEEWVEALEYAYREGWKSAAACAQRIQQERNIDRVAREAWWPALEACVLPRPVRGADLYEAFTANDAGLDRSEVLERRVGDFNGGPPARMEAAEGHSGSETAGKHSFLHEARTHRRLLEQMEKEIEELSERRLRQRQELQEDGRFSFLQHEMRRLQTEVKDLRESYSWKITAPLRVLAKPVMERIGRRK
jgi:hypothetical protein